MFYCILCMFKFWQNYCKVDAEVIPPPPPLPAGLQELNQIKRAYSNDGVGTMEAYLKLKESEKQLKAGNGQGNDGDKQPTGGNNITTVPTDEGMYRTLISLC